MNAAAFIVGPQDGAGAALSDLGRRLGFSPLQPYVSLRQSLKQADQTPLLFFLFAAVANVSSLKPVANALRFSNEQSLRFAPLIYFASELSEETIRGCIAMGFDDVIALPYANGDIGARLGRQMGETKTYYETSTYFGPDRRNRVGPQRSLGSDHGGGQFRRIEIVRSAQGINVLRDDFQVML
ncbi:MAG: hypothetical protein ABI697_05530 [Devosia sp.]